MNKLKRIYHISDIHIRNVKRHTEYRKVFDKMFEEIRKRGTEDSIIYLAGDIAHAKLEMSPELIKEISWLLTECTKHCLTIMITGNHDCNMNNADRLDVLTPLVDALDIKNLVYLKDTQVWKYGNTAFGVFSIFDKKENWPTAKNLDVVGVEHKIALFHGPVDNSKTDIGYVVSSRHFTTDMFDGYDLALLGDIHKRQELLSPSGCKIVYAGSLVQQNFGETVDRHGFIVWDMETRTYEEVDIKNDYGYYTLEVDNGIVPDVNDIPTYAHLRVKLSNTDTALTKKVVMEIKRKYKIKDFTIIRTDSIGKSKTGNRSNNLEFDNVSDINYQTSLINDYLTRMLPHITVDDLHGIEIINRDINSRIKPDEIHRNIRWKPVTFTFENMFSYGEDNKIQFSKIDGLMGLFAPNASGKSSLFDAISFCLYDKCSRAFKAQNILNNRKSTFKCELLFEIDGVPYTILREAKTVNKGKNVKVSVQFWKIENDISISLNGNERRDTNAIIEQYVGRYEDFVLTALSLQGNNALFIDKSQTERKELLAQFMGLNIFDKLYETANEDIKEVNALIKNFKRNDFTTELNENVISLKDKEKDLIELNIKLDSLVDKKENIIKNIVSLNKELHMVDASLDIDILNSKKHNINSDIVSIEILKSKALDLIANSNQLTTDIFNTIQQKSTFNGIPIKEAKKQFDDCHKELTNLKYKIELLNQSLTTNKEKLANLETHKYDASCSFCMNNVFVKDAISTKETVKKQELEGLELNDSMNVLSDTFKSLSNVEFIWEELRDINTKYQKANSVKDKAESELKSFISKEELLHHQLDSINSEIKRYYDNENIINNNKEIEKKLNTYEYYKTELEKEIKLTTSLLTKLNGDIATISSYIRGYRLKIEEVKKLEEKYQLYEYYMDAISKDGVPYELISKALPVIENEVNNILGQVVDFGVVMDMDGKNINAKIVYEDQEWALEMSSGMEKFISGLAIRVALINICNLPRPNFLVIDEGFGTLDSDNISSLFMMMQYLKTQFDFIWIISHLEQMRDMVDGIIEIKKINGFSSIKS